METTKDISSLYLHFPYCQHLCNYCDFFKSVPRTPGDYQTFLSYLQQSIETHQQLLQECGFAMAPLKTLYLGGGTPSLWGKQGADFLSSFFKKQGITLEPECEFTMEMNPGSFSEDSRQAWKMLGVNRFSVGVQSLDANFLKILDRVHTTEQVHQSLTHLSESGENFSVDLMLGLPRSVPLKRNIWRELEGILAYRPNHLSVYILTVKSNYLWHRQIPQEDLIASEYLEVAAFLKERGFEHYEVSNFALPGKKSNHNLNYWKSTPMAALGPSAVGLLPGQGAGGAQVPSTSTWRYKWEANQPAFKREKLTPGQFKMEQIYMRLRTSLGITPSDFWQGEELERLNGRRKLWEERGLITTKHTAEQENLTLKATSQGFLYLDSLMDELLGLGLV